MFSNALRLFSKSATTQATKVAFVCPSTVASRTACVALRRDFATYKTSTGLVGLEVDPNGRETLQDLSADILEAVKKIPAESQYRKDVESWFSYISRVTAEHENIIDIEREIDLGQIEEVIVMAKDELKLVDYYYDMKGWELVAEAQKEADYIVEEMADSIYFSSPQARASYVSPEDAAAAAAAEAK